MLRATVLGAIFVIGSILLGAVAVSQMFGEAGAAPVTQAREDQITIWADGTVNGITMPHESAYRFFDADRPLMQVALDPQDYPPSSKFRIEAVWVGNSGLSPTTRCFRLFDQTSQTPVAGSEVCHVASSTQGINETMRLRSPSFTLSAGEHEYRVQAKATAEYPFTPEGAGVSAARVIAEWTERAR